MAITANHFTTPPKNLKASEYKGCKAGKANASSSPDVIIDNLLSSNSGLWRGCDMSGRGDHGRPTGYPKLDNILPGCGWPGNAMIEVVTPAWGMGELQLLVPLMRSVMDEGKWLLWISPPYLLHGPALVQAGIDTERILVISRDTACKDALWSMEKALQAEKCGLVLAWQKWLPTGVVRRLQLAAETGNTPGVLFQHKVSKCSHSSLCLQIKSPGGNNREDPLTREVTVIKARGSFRPRTVRLDLYQPSLHCQL